MAKPAKQQGTRVRLTKEFIRTVPPPTDRDRDTYRDTECLGLILRVYRSGKKVYYYDYYDPAGKRQSDKVGDALKIDPGVARRRVKNCGEDPAGEKRKQKAAEAQAASRTISAFLDEEKGKYWTDYLKRRRSGKATRARILNAWRPFVDIDMVDLDPDKVNKHRLARQDAGVQWQTLDRDRTALLAMLNYAVSKKVISRNPLGDKAFQTLKKEQEKSDDDHKRRRWLGERDEFEDIRDHRNEKIGERQRFMEALDDAGTPQYLRDICTLALNTGLRRGEIFNLMWSDVSLMRNQVTVKAATAKGNKERILPLNATAKQLLDRLSKVRHITGYIFANPDTNQPFTSLKHSWATLVERAKLEDFNFHDCRHDFASRLVQAGVDLYKVKDLLGHSSIILTERYAHLAPHQKHDAVRLLDRVA